MMEREKKEQQAIDLFFGEGEKTPYLMDSETIAFTRKMEDSLGEMNVLEREVPLDFTLQIDIDALLEKGIYQREKRKQQEETRTFMLSALIIVLSSVIWGNVLGWKTLFLWQWILLVPIAFMILPFIKKHNGKEVG